MSTIVRASLKPTVRTKIDFADLKDNKDLIKYVLKNREYLGNLYKTSNKEYNDLLVQGVDQYKVNLLRSYIQYINDKDWLRMVLNAVDKSFANDQTFSGLVKLNEAQQSYLLDLKQIQYLLDEIKVKVNLAEEIPNLDQINSYFKTTLQMYKKTMVPYLASYGVPKTVSEAIISSVDGKKQPAFELRDRLLEAVAKFKTSPTVQQVVAKPQQVVAKPQQVVAKPQQVVVEEETEEEVVVATRIIGPSKVEGPKVYVALEKGIQKLESWTSYIPGSKFITGRLRNKIAFLKMWDYCKWLSELVVRKLFCFDVFPDWFCGSTIVVVALMIIWTVHTVMACTRTAVELGSVLSLIDLKAFFQHQKIYFATYFEKLVNSIKIKTSDLEKLALALAFKDEIPALFQSAATVGIRTAQLFSLRSLSTGLLSVFQGKAKEQILSLGDPSNASGEVVGNLLSVDALNIAHKIDQPATEESNWSIFGWLFGWGSSKSLVKPEDVAGAGIIDWSNLATAFQSFKPTAQEGVGLTTDVSTFTIETVLSHASDSEVSVTVSKGDVSSMKDMVLSLPVAAVQKLRSMVKTTSPTLDKLMDDNENLLKALQRDMQSNAENTYESIKENVHEATRTWAKQFQQGLLPLPAFVPDVGGEVSPWLSTKEVMYKVQTFKDPYGVRPDVSIGLVGIQVTGLVICCLLVFFTLFCKFQGISFRSDKGKKKE